MRESKKSEGGLLKPPPPGSYRVKGSPDKVVGPYRCRIFLEFAESMPNILHNLIKSKGHMTKY